MLRHQIKSKLTKKKKNLNQPKVINNKPNKKKKEKQNNGHYLLGLILGREDTALLPSVQDQQSVFLNLSEKVGSEPGVAEEIERYNPHVSVHVTHQNQHRPFPKNPSYAPRIATLEQPSFVLQYEPVQP